MPAFWWEKCPLPSSSFSCSSEWLSHNRLGAAWSHHWHSLSWSSYLTCFSLTQEALRRKSDISCSFPWHRPWVCSTAEQWERMQRRHSPGAGRCEGGPRGDLWRGQQLGCTQQCSRQSFRMRSHLSGTNRVTLLFCLFSSLLWRVRFRLGIRRHFFCVKFDLLPEKLPGFPSLLVQSDEISSQIFSSSAPSPLSLTALLRVGLTAPDLVQLQWSSGRQRCLLLSFPALTPVLFLPFQSLLIRRSILFSLAALVLFFPSLSSVKQSHLQDAVAVDAVLLRSATRSADYRGWMGERRGDREPPSACPSQHSARLSPQLSQWQHTAFVIG